MTRLSIILLLAVITSALYLVHVQYESRRLFTEMEVARNEARRLDVERGRLQVEKRAQATPLRVEKLAQEKLGMRAATPAITQYVRDPAYATSATAAPARASGGASAKPVQVRPAPPLGALGPSPALMPQNSLRAPAGDTP
jgi:cell division protein FtsL